MPIPEADRRRSGDVGEDRPQPALERVEVHVSGRRRRPAVGSSATACRSAVRDTGVGIAAADVPRIFERFHRVEGASARTHEGSGIGLALVNDLVRLHGGACEVDERARRGHHVHGDDPEGARPARARHGSPPRQQPAFSPRANAFVVEALRWLPDARRPRPRDGAGARPSRSRRTRPPGHILLADDNADMRDYVTRLLQRRWTVEAVADGAHGARGDRARASDLLVTDVMMPGLDGFGLLRAVRADAAPRRDPGHACCRPAPARKRASKARGRRRRLPGEAVLRARAGRACQGAARLSQTSRERDELLAREQEARRDAELQKQHLFRCSWQAPVAIAILRGPTHVCRAGQRRDLPAARAPARAAARAAASARRCRSSPARAVEMLLDGVYATGEPSSARRCRSEFERPGGGRRDVYFDFVYTPLRDARRRGRRHRWSSPTTSPSR